MNNQYKRKIKVVSISRKFYTLFSPKDEIMQKLGQESKEGPCLILLKLKYKGKNIYLLFLLDLILVMLQKNLIFLCQKEIKQEMEENMDYTIQKCFQSQINILLNMKWVEIFKKN